MTTDVLGWDVRTWSVALRHWENAVDWSRVHDCLELGASEGGLSLWLARKGAHVVCSDLTDAEKRARPLHDRHTFTGTVEYADVDATAIPYDGCFDVVVLKSVLGGIGRGGREQQRTAIAQARKALRPGGSLLFAENLLASPLHQLLRRRFTPWGGTWRYVTTAELADFLAPFRRFELRTTGVAAAFGRNERQRDALARLDQALLNRLTPARWQYVGYGVATA